jgi:hypothetical protein
MVIIVADMRKTAATFEFFPPNAVTSAEKYADSDFLP